MTWYVCSRVTSAVLFVAQRICELNCIQVVIHAADAIREQLAQHGGRPEWQLRNRTRFRAIELSDGNELGTDAVSRHALFLRLQLGHTRPYRLRSLHTARRH